ncbi:MAG: DUF4158 domain-containing protein [Actinobacteria bacterium]|nr:DUF4158 domain-containing protein [Actinomycetota bacterium]
MLHRLNNHFCAAATGRPREAEQLSNLPPEVVRSDLVAHFTLSVDGRRWVRSHRGPTNVSGWQCSWVASRT